MSYNSAEWAHPPTHVSVQSSKESSETTQWPLVYNQSSTGVSALRPATLCYAHYTEPAAQRKPAQLWHSASPFAISSRFILMTHGKSTWPIYEAVSAATLVHQAEIQVLQEMTVWNLNISNHGKCNILVTWAIWDLAHSSQGQWRRTNAAVAWCLSQFGFLLDPETKLWIMS